MHGRILLTLGKYLVKYSKVFDKTYIKVTEEDGVTLPNGTLLGLKRLLSTEEIDIGVQSTIMLEANMKVPDFAYPFQMLSATFIIRKPGYKPEVLGILKTFSK